MEPRRSHLLSVYSLTVKSASHEQGLPNKGIFAAVTVTSNQEMMGEFTCLAGLLPIVRFPALPLMRPTPYCIAREQPLQGFMNTTLVVRVRAASY